MAQTNKEFILTDIKNNVDDFTPELIKEIKLLMRSTKQINFLNQEYTDYEGIDIFYSAATKAGRAKGIKI